MRFGIFPDGMGVFSICFSCEKNYVFLVLRKFGIKK